MVSPDGESGDLRKLNVSKEEETSLCAFMEASPDGALVVNCQGAIVLVNSELERLSGYPSDELVGQHVDVLVPERYHRTHSDQVADYMHQPQPIAIGIRRNLHGRHKDGSEIPVEIGLNPIELERDTIVLAMIRDITERRRVEERQRRYAAQLKQANVELQRSNQQLGEFAYVASHDLQEPLRSVGHFCQLLKQQYKGRLDEQADMWIDFAVDGAQRMRTLIDDLLAYSRVTTQTQQFEVVDCSAVMHRVIANLSSSIEQSRAEVIQADLPTVTADKTQMLQLFQNLIGNAIKFRKEKTPKVHVGAERHEDEWIFAVRDNGIGIEPEHRERVFKMFKRLHTHEQYAGNGVGLAICKRIVERHGGRIWLESQSGEGTVFFFSIPDTADEDNA